MIYAYSNNGLSFRAVDANYVAQPGEVIFTSGQATPTQLAAAFSGYTAAAAIVAAQTAAAAALNAGVTINSTSAPAINGTYAINPSSLANINGTVTYILLNDSFPGNNTTMNWYDAANTAHTFPSVTVFKAFATAYTNYVAALNEYILSGSTGSLPASTVTIA